MDSQNSHELLWQSFFALAMFISTFASYLLPILIFTYRSGQLQIPSMNEDYMHLPNDSTESLVSPELNSQILKKRRRLKKILSYCNCVSGGVFLGVCFLNLIPCVEDEFARLIKDYQILKHYFGNFPLGLFSVICGLFLVLILETLLSSQFDGSSSTSSSPTSTRVQNSGTNFSGADINGSLSGFTPSSTVNDSNVNVYVDDDSNQYESEQILGSSLKESTSSSVTLNKSPTHVQSHDNHDENNREHGHSHSEHHHHHENHQHSHGHSHMTVDMFKDKSDSMLSFFILMFATSIHSLFEGLALGLQSDISNAIRLFIGIIIHECLVAFALGLNAVRLQQNDIKIRMHLKFAFLFSLTIPVGNILGILLGYTPGHTGRFISAIFQGLAAGTFIHVTFLELIPEELLSNNDDFTCDSDLIYPNNDSEQSTLTSKGHNNHFDSPNNDSDSIHCDDILSDNQTDGDQHSQRKHKLSSKSTKMRKILLLLFGFLIMTIIPFITEQ